MCKQDVRIGRAGANTSVSAAVAAGGSATLLKANPERLTLNLNLVLSGGDVNTLVEITANNGGTPLGLGVLSHQHPTFVRTVEQMGLALTGEIVANANGTGAAGYTVRATEMYLTRDLDTID